MIIHWVVCSSNLNYSFKHCIQTYSTYMCIIGVAGKSLGIQKWYQVYPYHSIKFRQLYVMVRFLDLRTIPVTWWICVENFWTVKKVTRSCSQSLGHLSRPTSFNIGLGLFLFTSYHFILFFTKSHWVLYFQFRFVKNQICDKRQHVMYNVQCWAKQIHWFKKMMYRQEQSISLTSFLSWFKLDRKCNFATGFCAVHQKPNCGKNMNAQ